MKFAAILMLGVALASGSSAYSQTGYTPGKSSIDCSKARNTVALILCSGPEAAQADWDLNSASWALYFTLDDAARQVMGKDQQVWRQSLDRICALPPPQTPEGQTGQAIAETIGRIILGPEVRIPGVQPITPVHVNCVISAYRARAATLRSRLTGDALTESQLSPGQRTGLQEALAEKGFLRSAQIGPGTHDGEFGPITRNAIKQFQQSLGAPQSGYLSQDQRSALLAGTRVPTTDAKAIEDASAREPSRGIGDANSRTANSHTPPRQPFPQLIAIPASCNALCETGIQLYVRDALTGRQSPGPACHAALQCRQDLALQAHRVLEYLRQNITVADAVRKHAPEFGNDFERRLFERSRITSSNDCRYELGAINNYWINTRNERGARSGQATPFET